MPVTIHEGRRLASEQQIIDRRAEKRFFDLAAAVREHELKARRNVSGQHGHDDALYRRLRQICGDAER